MNYYLLLIKIQFKQKFGAQILKKRLLQIGIAFGVCFILLETIDKQSIYMLFNFDGSNTFVRFFFIGITLDFILKGFLIRSFQDANLLAQIPIKRKTLTNYILTKILFESYNILIFCIVIFIVPQLEQDFENLILIYPLCLLALLNNSLIIVLFRLKLSIPFFFLLMLAAVTLAGYFIKDESYLIDLPLISESRMYFFVGLQLAFFVFLISETKKLIHKTLYLDKIHLNIISDRFLIFSLNYHSKYLSLILEEILLIIRNRRSKEYVLGGIIVFILVYFLAIETVDHSSLGTLLLMILLTSFPSLNYLQLAFGWQGKYFDEILVRSIYIEDLLVSKHIFFSISSILLFISISPLYLGKTELWISAFVSLLFNMGFNSFLLLYFTLFNRQTINLANSTIMNYEGLNPMQFLGVAVTIAIPSLIFSIGFNLFSKVSFGLYAVGLTGIFGLIMTKPIIKWLSNNFKRNKYKLLDGFRGTTY